MMNIQLAPLLYTTFIETETEPVVGAPAWQDLRAETQARWIRMATLLQNKVRALEHSRDQP